MATPYTSAQVAARAAAPVSRRSFPIPAPAHPLFGRKERWSQLDRLGRRSGWVAWLFLFGSSLPFAMWHANRLCLLPVWIVHYIYIRLRNYRVLVLMNEMVVRLCVRGRHATGKSAGLKLESWKAMPISVPSSRLLLLRDHYATTNDSPALRVMMMMKRNIN
jgi:hypothetical protein